MTILKPLIENKWYYSYRGNGYGAFDEEIAAIRDGRNRGAKFVYVYRFENGQLVPSPNRLYHAVWGQPV